MHKCILVISILISAMISGCAPTESQILEEVTENEYAYTICSGHCDSEIEARDDSVSKAKIAGINDERIKAALLFGSKKARREILKSQIIAEQKLKTKCASQEKIVCGYKCCNPTYALDEAAAATEAAVDATAPAAEAATAISEDKFLTDLGEWAESVEKNTGTGSKTALLPINIKQGMEYSQARNILISSGWQAVTSHKLPNGTPVCFLVASMQDWSFQVDKACEYIEIDACSGTGMGFCKMLFHDGKNTFLSVITSGGHPPDAVIHEWSKDQTYESNVISNDDLKSWR